MLPMTMGNHHRTENGCLLFAFHHGPPFDSSRRCSQVHRYPHQQKTRRNRKCRVCRLWKAAVFLPLTDGTISYPSFASWKCEKALYFYYSPICTNSGQKTPLGPPGAKSQSKIPSRLRESSIASFVEPEATGASPGSRSSSPGTAATTTSSVLGNGRANGTNGGGDEKRMPSHIPTPPRPLPPVTRRPETDYLIGKQTVRFCRVCL